jgi:hypothetical protein
MRTIFIILLVAAPVIAQERTWTITTAVQTVEAELLSIRGDVVYLKVGDTVESVPLARLSVADHEYIASLSLAPVRSGPTLSVPQTGATSVPTMVEEIAPPAAVINPPIGEEALPAPSAPAAGQGTRGAATGGTTGGRSTNVRGTGGRTTTPYRSTSAATRGASSSTARRVTPPSNQMQSGPRGNSNSNPGILGIRERRNERQRGR